MGYGLIVEKRQDGIERSAVSQNECIAVWWNVYFYYLDRKLLRN